MNNEIAGKMISAVNGFDDVKAATANELKATRSGMPVHNAMLNDLHFVSNSMNFSYHSYHKYANLP